jgi:hypothetical protein
VFVVFAVVNSSSWAFCADDRDLHAGRQAVVVLYGYHHHLASDKVTCFGCQFAFRFELRPTRDCVCNKT